MTERTVKLREYVINLADVCSASFRTLSIQPNNQHDVLFHYLHQAYDLKACSVIYDTLYQPNQPNPASQQAFYETQVTSLRENKPNQFDPLNIWEDVLMPRIQFFESLVMKKMNSGYSSNYGFSPSLSSLAREMRLQLSNIAKEHGLLNTAVKLFPQSIDIDRDISNVEEYLDYIEKECSISAACNTKYEDIIDFLNRKHMPNFANDKDNQSHLDYYRIKGEYYFLAHDYDNANKSYTTVLNVNKKNNKAWKGWGDTYYQLWLEKKNENDGVNAICSYIQACSAKKVEYWKLICRVFFIMSATSNSQKVIDTFTKYQDRAVIHMWIPFMPFLVYSYNFKEYALQNLLKSLNSNYSQMVRYNLIYQDPDGLVCFIELSFIA